MAMTLTTTKQPVSQRINKPAAENRAIVTFPTEIHLSPRDSKLFLAALSAPPKPNQKLKKAVARFKKMMENNR